MRRAVLSPSYDRVLEVQLATYVRWLPYQALELLVVYVLRKSGYASVRIADHGKQRGYRDDGGWNLAARKYRTDVTDLTLVQVKHIPVQRRNVDELAGAMRRRRAKSGLIFTTDRIAEAAFACADQHPGRPIKLISPHGLVRMMIQSGLGVRTEPAPPGDPHKLILDEKFFDMLTEQRP